MANHIKDKDGYFGAIIFGGPVLYSIYCVYNVSLNFNKISFPNSHYFFNDGWKFLNRKRDIIDDEWETAKLLFISLYPWIFLYSAVSVLLHNEKYIKILPIFQIILSASYIIFNFNLPSLILIVLQPTIFEILSKIRYKSNLITWFCALTNLLLFHYFNVNLILDYFQVLNITNNQSHMLHIALYWINLRCVCYYIDHNEKQQNSNFIEALSYCLYLPLLFLGPFIPYKDFQKSRDIENYKLKAQLKLLLKRLFRFIFWWTFTEVFLHYIYVNVISSFPELVESFDSTTLYGFGYCMGQFFHLKYVVMYGLSTSFAQFDGIPIPNVPKCIGRIHLYSDMWKYFDNGLYQFLLRYIYIPTNKAISSPYISNIISFSFVYLWHGFLRTDIFIWAAFNCFGVCLERIFKSFYASSLRFYTTKYLNQFWERHLGCMINSPLLMMSAVSNFYFFGGTAIGHIFVRRILEDKFSSTFILLLTLYGNGLFSIYVKKIEMKKKKVL